MTKFQKQMLTIAAAGALTAVTALPAMAFENEFHGIYNFNTVFSNYNNGGGGNLDFGINALPAGVPTTAQVALGNFSDKRKMNNYMEQRARIQYIAKASDDLKLVTHFELNSRFGNAADGADLDTDGINIWTKHVYLDFNVGKGFNAKIGLQPYKDTIKGIFIDADTPAVMTTTKLGSYTLGLGFARYGAESTPGTQANWGVKTGEYNKDLFIMDNTVALNKDTKVGLSYYFLSDYSDTITAANLPQSAYAGYTNYLGQYTHPLYGHNRDQAVLLHTLGLSGQTKIGNLNLSGFAAMQAGHQKLMTATNTSRNFHGWAANVAADMKVGSGKAKAAFLFASGNTSTNRAQYNGWVSSSVDSYNESGMMILARNTYNSPTSTDQYIRRDVSNIALLTAGYDAQLTEKFNLNGNVGFAWAPSSADAPFDLKTGTRNNSDFMGTEMNVEAGYQLYKNLKLQAQAGYMILGGYYKNSALKNGTTGAQALTGVNAVDPENPYTMRLQARYSF
ncbi:MAG: hypothetical protein PHN92_11920 [Geobacter sp.]|nr:hypothetical protein [Geobacter sp.]